MTRSPGNADSTLADLLRRALGGDQKAYADFLRAVAPLVRGAVQRKAAAAGFDTEDIVQETLMAVHAKRHTWRQDAPVLPWVFAIARHKTIDAFRRRGRHVVLDIDDFSETIAAPEAETVSARELDRALQGLAPGQRAVVSSISVEGLSIGETAARLGMSEAAVRVALHRGLNAIRKRPG